MNPRVYRYDNNGGQVLVYVDEKDLVHLFMNDEHIHLEASSKNREEYSQIANGKTFLLKFDKMIVRDPHLFIDGQEISTLQYVNPYNRLSLDNIRTLSQYPPITGLSDGDFYAIKTLNGCKIIQWPNASENNTRYYLKISDIELDKHNWVSFKDPSSEHFLPISEYDIKPGDDILVVQEGLMAKRMQLIENVSSAVIHTFVPHVPPDYANEFNQSPIFSMRIEGDNIVLTTDSIAITPQRDMIRMLSEHGLEADAFAEIFTPDTSLWEFSTMQRVLGSGVEITEDLLQKFVSGELNTSNLKEYIQSLKEQQDIDEISIDRQ